MATEKRKTIARIGIATPQANPTAEPEIASQLPADVHALGVRCVASGTSEQRLSHYLVQLAGTLERFGGLELNAVAFACTGSSYLLPPDQVRQIQSSLEDRYSYPVIIATDAIEQSLRELNARKILLASPYPTWLQEAAVRFWTSKGFDIVGELTAQPDMGDTSAIYDLDPFQALDRFTGMTTDREPDAILVTGTGMPSLPILEPLSRHFHCPALSSNLCLARACLAIIRSA